MVTNRAQGKIKFLKVKYFKLFSYINDCKGCDEVTHLNNNNNRGSINSANSRLTNGLVDENKFEISINSVKIDRKKRKTCNEINIELSRINSSKFHHESNCSS